MNDNLDDGTYEHEEIEGIEEVGSEWLAYALQVDLALLMQDHLQLKNEKYTNNFIQYSSHEEYDRAIDALESQIIALDQRIIALRG